MNDSIKYVAELSGVTDVTLIGSADLEFWRQQLSPFGLVPVAAHNRAVIHVIAASANFKCLPFREISFAVVVEPTPTWHQLPDAACLLRAFNSSRFFAWCERVFFKTPYYPAHCEIEIDPPRIVVAHNGNTFFEAATDSTNDRPATAENAENFGTVALLPQSGRSGDPLRYFVARIAGEGVSYAFDPDRDRLLIAASSGVQVLEDLAASGFTGERWIVRTAATHVKSKTY